MTTPKELPLLQAAEVLQLVANASPPAKIFTMRIAWLAELCRNHATNNETRLSLQTVQRCLFATSNNPDGAWRRFLTMFRKHAFTLDISVEVKYGPGTRSSVWVEGESPAEALAINIDRQVSDYALQSLNYQSEVTPAQFRRKLQIAIDFDNSDDTSAEVADRLEDLLKLETIDISIRQMQPLGGQVIDKVRREVHAWADLVITLLIPRYLNQLLQKDSDLLGDEKQVLVRVDSAVNPNSRGISGRAVYPEPFLPPSDENFVPRLIKTVIDRHKATELVSASEGSYSAKVKHEVFGPTPIAEDGKPVERTRAVRTKLNPKAVAKAEAGDYSEVYGERFDDLHTYLLDWACNPTNSRYLLLMGEYGMGKTTAVQELTRRLVDLRHRKVVSSDNTDESRIGVAHEPPMPIYIDLSLLSNIRSSNPSLDELLEDWATRVWQSSAVARDWTAHDVKQAVQQRGAIVIFDGLDEVLNSLSGHQGRVFLNSLWSILPPSFGREDKHSIADTNATKMKTGRVVFTCRSHYFPTLREEAALVQGKSQRSITEQEFEMLLVLPFNAKQIRHYLEVRLDETTNVNVDRAMELLNDVHDLEDLASRPMHLQIIAQQLELIEEASAAGTNYTAADLYDNLCRSTLSRDNSKHQLKPEHKLFLMEELAAELWQNGIRELTANDLDDWVSDVLAKPGRLNTWFQLKNIDIDVLLEDTRTATFVVRPGAEGFSFSHASLQEYFLARYLARALIETAPDRWNIPMPSAETLQFLYQIIVSLPDNREAISTLESIKRQYRPKGSEVAFAYSLMAHNSAAYSSGAPIAPSLKGFDLRAANLSQIRVESPLEDKSKWLDLSGCDFSGAALQAAQFRRVILNKSIFDGCNLDRAEFDTVALGEASFKRASLAGTIIRKANTEGVKLSGALPYRMKWIECTTDPELHSDLPSGSCLVAPQEARSELLSASSRPQIATIAGHTGWVVGVAWSPDGSELASASDDASVRVWDPKTGECMLKLAGHTGWVLGVAWSPNGSNLVSGGGDNAVRIWDAQTGECLRVMTGHSDWVLGVSWSPDSSRLVSCGRDKSLRVWDAQTGECLRVMTEHSDWVLGVSWSPDASRLVSCGRDKSLRVWDAQTGECLRVMTGHSDWVLGVSWSPDGSRLASGGNDKSLRLWDSESGECLRVFSEHSGGVTAMAWSPDGLRLASGSEDKSLRVWDTETGDCMRELIGHSGGVLGVSYSPDGLYLVSGSKDRSLRVWDAETGECLLPVVGHTSWVLGVAWSPDGSRLVSGNEDTSLRTWDTITGACLRVFHGHSGRVLGMAWSPDGSRLVSGGEDRSLRVWDSETGECLGVLTGHSHKVWGITWSPDASRLVSASEDKSLRIWDTETGDCIRELIGHSGGVLGVSYSPDGLYLVSGSKDRSLRVWDAETGECKQVLAGHTKEVLAVGWSHDSSCLVSGSEDTSLRVWDVETGECKQVLTGHTKPVLGVAWSPDSSHLVSGSEDTSLRVWDAETGECKQVLTGHTDRVLGVGWSPDGTRLASCSEDPSIRIWDVATGEYNLVLHQLPGGEWATVDQGKQTLMAVSEEAWRWLVWRVPQNTFDAAGDKQKQLFDIWPAETFGQLPVHKSS